MRKKWSVLVLAVILLIFMPKSANAAKIKTKLDIKSTLSQCEYDETQNRMFALSRQDKNVTIINTESMEIENQITFSNEPFSMNREGNAVYISFPENKEIKKFDSSTGKEVGSYTVKENPYHVLANGKKIYYFCTDDVVELQLETMAERKLNIMPLKYARFTIDKENQILYVGQVGLSRTDLIYYDLKTDKIIAKTEYEPVNRYPSATIMFYDQTLYYADRDFDRLDCTRFEGDYDRDTIEDIKGDIVYGLQGIYDRITHERIGTYGEDATIVISGEKTVFIYVERMRKLYKYIANEKITKENVISVVKGTKAAEIQQTEQAERKLDNFRRVTMQSELNTWFLDEENHMIYASSYSDKALFFIDEATLDIKKSISFKSKPVDLAVYNGYLYVSLNDSYEIKVIDLKAKEVVNTIRTQRRPVDIEIDLDTIYFTTNTIRDKGCLFGYDLNTQVERVVYNDYRDSLYSPNLEINRKDHILYIAESGLSSCKLFYLDTKTDTIIAKTTDGKIHSYADGNIIFDGTDVYYDGRAIDAYDPNKILRVYKSNYYKESIKCVKNNRVYTDIAVYDRETGTVIETKKGEKKLYQESKDGFLFEYDSSLGEIIKIKKENIKTVSFDSLGGTKISSVDIDINDKVTLPEAPRKNGFTFIGWYKDEMCTIPYITENELVTDHTTLYAGWLINSARPSALKAVVNGASTISLSWTNVRNADGYLIYRATSAKGSYVYIGETKNNQYKDTTVKPGIIYYYKVKAFREQGGIKAYGIYSETVSAKTTLGMVSGLQGSATAQDKIAISWNKVEGATGYEIYVSNVANGNYTLVASTSDNKHTITRLMSNRAYCYKVRAYQNINQKRVYGNFSMIASSKTKAGQSNVTKTVAATTTTSKKIVVNKPTAFNAKKASKNSTKVTWKKVSGANGYEVYRCNKKNGTYKKVKGLSGTSYTDKKLSKKKTYYYKVRAYKIVNKKKVYSGYTAIKYVKL